MTRSLSARCLLLLLLALLLLLLTTAGSAPALTILVPESYTTIGGALLMAGTGDTISVAPGTYHEHLVWPATPGITLLSRVPRQAVVSGVVDDVMVRFGPGLDATTVIEGFEICNGEGPFGAGILCEQSGPTIRNNYIHHCTADNLGGGVACVGASPLIIANRFEYCSAPLGAGIYLDGISMGLIEADTIWFSAKDSGEGIYCGGYAEIRGCVVSGSSGAGIYCWASPLIEGCAIENNQGRGIVCEGSATIRLCRIRGNGGGGIQLLGGGTGLIEGNTIEDHVAGDGAGILCVDSSPTIRGNTIRFNDARAGLAGGIYIHGGRPLVERNEITHNNSDYEASGVYCCLDSTRLWWNDISHNTCGLPNAVGSGLFI